MQPVNNPNQKAIQFSAALLVLSLISVVLGLMLDGDLGFWTASLGGVALFIAIILLPVMIWDGKKRAKAIQALLSGEGLLAHWRYHPYEWNQFALQERTRELAEARKVSLYTLPIVLGMGLVGGLFSDLEMDGTYIVVIILTGLGMSAFLGGLLAAGAQLTFQRNQSGVGEAYISGTGVYFHGKYHTWTGAGVRLTAVEFLPGDPAVIAFRYEATVGDTVQAHAARVPVPRGNEEAAQAVVNRFYEGG
ncbi:MAG TPA: hypothetical protein VD902_17490 [Symbiobacteriaceae bacterium]|nr:hypothetical protein [Symbiobacteriaceae bacterium]